MARTGFARAARIGVLITCGLAIAGLFGAVVRQSWVNNSAQARIVTLEQQGAETLHPLIGIIGELVELQSKAVRGVALNTDGLQEELAQVHEIERKHGDSLQMSQRLLDLESQLQIALARHETGRPAYETYAGLVTLALELVRAVGDSSHLVHDPDLDSYYVMESAIVRLPEAMVNAGRAADLVALSSNHAVGGEDATRVAVARYNVSAAADAVVEGLTKSVTVTERSALGTNIADRLDSFKTAADAFAPPTMAFDLSGPVAAETLAANAQRVFAAANPLAHRLLSELQALLEVRANDLAGQWRFTAAASGIAVAVGLGLIWMLAMSRPRAAFAGPGGQGDDELPVGTLSYAREILESEELVHVGRAVRARGRGDAL